MIRMRRLLGKSLLFSVLLVSTFVGRARAQQEREYGWYVDQQDTLVFVVQLDPAELKALQTNVDLIGESANMPPELVGRVTRVEVRLGEAPLPRTPSLGEIEKRPAIVSKLDVSDILGEGRLAEIDESRLVPVQSGTVGLPNMSAPSTSRDFLSGCGRSGCSPTTEHFWKPWRRYAATTGWKLFQILGHSPRRPHSFSTWQSGLARERSN